MRVRGALIALAAAGLLAASARAQQPILIPPSSSTQTWGHGVRDVDARAARLRAKSPPPAPREGKAWSSPSAPPVWRLYPSPNPPPPSQAGRAASIRTRTTPRTETLPSGNRVERQVRQTVDEATGQVLGEVTHGTYVERYSSGQVAHRGRVHEDLQDGTWEHYYENGTHQLQATYEKGVRHGPWTEWFPDGGLFRRGGYDRNRLDGVWRIWDASGAFVREVRYNAGRVVAELRSEQLLGRALGPSAPATSTAGSVPTTASIPSSPAPVTGFWPARLRDLRHEFRVQALMELAKIEPPDPAVLPDLVSVLDGPHRSTSIQEQALAAKAIAHLGPAASGAVGALAGLLDSPSRELPDACVEALVAIGPAASPAIPEVVHQIGQERLPPTAKLRELVAAHAELAVQEIERQTRSADPPGLVGRIHLLRVVAGLGKQGELAGRFIQAGMADGNGEVRRAACSAIRELRLVLPAGIGQLALMLRDPSAAVRAEAAGAFEAIGLPALPGLPALRETLLDPNAGVRDAAGSAVRALERLQAMTGSTKPVSEPGTVTPVAAAVSAKAAPNEGAASGETARPEAEGGRQVGGSGVANDSTSAASRSTPVPVGSSTAAESPGTPAPAPSALLPAAALVPGSESTSPGSAAASAPARPAFLAVWTSPLALGAGRLLRSHPAPGLWLLAFSALSASFLGLILAFRGAEPPARVGLLALGRGAAFSSVLVLLAFAALESHPSVVFSPPGTSTGSSGSWSSFVVLAALAPALVLFGCRAAVAPARAPWHALWALVGGAAGYLALVELAAAAGVDSPPADPALWGAICLPFLWMPVPPRKSLIWALTVRLAVLLAASCAWASLALMPGWGLAAVLCAALLLLLSAARADDWLDRHAAPGFYPGLVASVLVTSLPSILRAVPGDAHPAGLALASATILVATLVLWFGAWTARRD